MCPYRHKARSRWYILLSRCTHTCKRYDRGFPLYKCSQNCDKNRGAVLVSTSIRYHTTIYCDNIGGQRAFLCPDCTLICGQYHQQLPQRGPLNLSGCWRLLISRVHGSRLMQLFQSTAILRHDEGHNALSDPMQYIYMIYTLDKCAHRKLCQWLALWMNR